MARSVRHAPMRLAIAALGLFLVAGCAKRTPAPAPRPPATEQRFPDPKAAVDALLAACRTDDEPALLAIFGNEARTMVSTGDPAATASVAGCSSARRSR